MGNAATVLDASAVIASKSVIARLAVDIEQYEGLLRSSLGPKTRKMFEHLLSRARAELAVIEAEEAMSHPWLEETFVQH